MDTGIFIQISAILAIATLISGVMLYLKQPLIIGHIITGILVGPAIFNLVNSAQTPQVFTHIGVAILAFVVGLGLNPKIIKELGKVSLVTAMTHIGAVLVAGYVLASLLGFGGVAGFYIALGLAFSSTIIVLKILSDKKELHRLHGKIATGFLLVQDMAAVAVLMLVSSFGGESLGHTSALLALIKGALLLGGVAAAAIYLLPKLMRFFARSQEYLFIFSIGWGLGVAALFAGWGFAAEIGALVAGIALAGSNYAFEIGSRLKPLRDFFLILFFIIIGASVTWGDVRATLGPALVLSGFTLIGTPIVVMMAMGALGYTRKTSFRTGVAVAQISEFSLVLVLLVSKAGHISSQIVTLMTLVALITMAGSTYLMLYDDRLFKRLERYLRVFERAQARPQRSHGETYDIILFGYKAGGAGFIKAFARLGRPYLVVDYDPETIDHLESLGVTARYGDANDSEFLETINFHQARLVIINLTDFATNALICEHARSHNRRTIIVAMTKSDERADDALELYDRGASYVMMPRYLSSLKIGNLLKRYELDGARFRVERERHKRFLAAQR